MTDPKFKVFSEGLVSRLIETINKNPRLSRYGIPSYEILEDMADHSTMPVLLDLTERQKQDYEVLRANLKGLLKQYGVKSPEMTPADYLIAQHARKVAGIDEEPEPILSDKDRRIYEKLNFWLTSYAKNADLNSARRRKSDF